MVHRRFFERNLRRGLSEEEEEMNGMRQFSPEVLSELETRRRAERDRVSQRMGELLLLGHTMLGDYCDQCSGILMQDRTGNRFCIACRMTQEENEHNRSLIVDESSDTQQQPTTAITSRHSAPVNGGDVQVKLTTPEMRFALSAVNNKICWIGERLRASEDIDDCRRLIELLNLSIDLLFKYPDH